MSARSAGGRLARAAVLAVAAALLLAVPAAAQQGANGGIGSGVTGFGLGDWFGLVTRLALVVLVIWAAVYAMRWYVRRMSGGGPGGRLRQMEILETHALGPNRALHLVRLGDRAVLIGATAERINPLLQIDDPAEVERLAELPEELEARARPGSLGSLLRSSRGGSPSLGSVLLAGLATLRARFRPAPAAEASETAAEGEVMVEAPPAAVAAPRRPFSMFDLMAQPASEPFEDAELDALSDAELAELEAAVLELDEAEEAERAAPPKPRRRSALLEGFRRLPEAFRMPVRARRPETRPAQPVNSAAQPASTPHAAVAPSETTAAGLFDRYTSPPAIPSAGVPQARPSVDPSAPGLYRASARPRAGGFSAALAAMEARDRASNETSTRGPGGAPAPRISAEREAAAERAGLGELARDPEAFRRMTREQQIAQVQRAIMAVRDPRERSA